MINEFIGGTVALTVPVNEVVDMAEKLTTAYYAAIGVVITVALTLLTVQF